MTPAARLLSTVRPLTVLVAFSLGAVVPFLVSARLQEPGTTAASATVRRTPVVQVAEQASPAVVAIEVDRRATWGFRRSRFSGEGSGVFINERGYVITNYHVIREAESIRVLLNGGATLRASLVATSEESDLALLRVESPRQVYPHLRFGRSSSLLPGETVLALGNPYGLQHTVSTGVVSAVKRAVRLPNSEEYNDFIQTDAAINPGNSGGALVNLNTELVGINTAIFNKGWGIAFAIPVDRVKEILASYVYKEHYTGLETVARRDGLRVVAVRPHSPGTVAGLRPGDLLLRAEGQALETPADLAVASLGADAQHPLSIQIRRSGVEQSVRITPLSLLWDRMGVRGSPQTIRLASGKSRRGLRVEQVRQQSSAESLDLRSGDIIFRVQVTGKNGKADAGAVTNEADLARLLEQYSGRRWSVEILRGGRLYEGTVTPRP